MIILAGKNKFFAALWSKNARYVEVKENRLNVNAIGKICGKPQKFPLNTPYNSKKQHFYRKNLWQTTKISDKCLHNSKKSSTFAEKNNIGVL